MLKRYFIYICFIIVVLTGCPIPTNSVNPKVAEPEDPYAGGNHPPIASFPSWDYEVTGAEVDDVNQCYTASGTSYGRTMYTGDGNPQYQLFAFSAPGGAWGIHDVQSQISNPEDLTYYQMSNNLCPPFDGWFFSSNDDPSILEIVSVPIDGDVSSVGNVMTAVYVFSDSDADSEGATIYQWYRCENESDSGEAISGANGTVYTTVADDLNHYLKFEVTPVDEFGLAGTPVKSKACCQIGG